MPEEKRYSCKCSECGHEFWAAKSIVQHWGHNDCGHRRCPNCDTFLNLTFDPEAKIMVTMPWNEYVEKVREERERKRGKGTVGDQGADPAVV